MTTINEIDFPFCPRCGSALTKKTLRNTICKNCGLDYYVNPRPCNAIIIVDDMNRVLLVKRAVDPYKSLWDLPGGFVDIGETVEESVVREAKEELDIEVDTIEYLFSGYDRYAYKGLNYHTLCFFFTAHIHSGKMRPLDDVRALRYFGVEEIPWDTLGFPTIKTALMRFLQREK